MSRPKTNTSKNEWKNSKVFNSKSINSFEQFLSTLSNSSGSSVPLIVTDCETEKKFNENFCEIISKKTINDENVQLLRKNEFIRKKRTNGDNNLFKRSNFQPVIKEFSKNSKKSISRASFRRLKLRKKFRRPSDDLKFCNLLAKKKLNYLPNNSLWFKNYNNHKYSNSKNDYISHVNNFNNIPFNYVSQYNQLNQDHHSRSNEIRELNLSTYPINDRFPNQLYGQIGESRNQAREHGIFGNLPLIKRSTVDKCSNLDVTNDKESQPYSMNAISNFEVPNFKTNKFEKIQFEKINSSEKYPENDKKYTENKKIIDLSENNAYSTEDSNNEIYGLCTALNRTSKKSVSEFVDLRSELYTSIETFANLNNNDQQNNLESNSQNFVKECLDGYSNATNAKYEEEEMGFESTYDNQIPEMTMSKCIEFTSEIESDYMTKSIVKESENYKLKVKKFKKMSDKLLNSREIKLDNKMQSKLNNSNRIKFRNKQMEIKFNERSDINEKFDTNSIKKLFELHAIEQKERVKEKSKKYQPEKISNLQHEILSSTTWKDHSKNRINRHMVSNYRVPTSCLTNYSQHDNYPKLSQFGNSNHIYNQPISFEQSDMNKQDESITVSPVRQNLFKLQQLSFANKQPQTNFYFQPDPNGHKTYNFPHFKNQTGPQRHFLVSFKHYYPEKSSWAFILVICVSLIHALQFVFQFENLLIIHSSVYFNTSLTLSVFTGALSSGISLFLAPFVISFCERNSSRLIAFLGSIICSLGLLFTSFATLPDQLLIAYSLFFGVGSSLLRESSANILSKYFKRRRILVEMIIIFSCYIFYAFLPIMLSNVINIRNWRKGLQVYATFFFICFFICILMRPASLYHPQRRAISHLKSLQKINKLKNKQQSKIGSDESLDSIHLSFNKLCGNLICIDYSPLHSRTIQLLLCSICLISFGIYHPIFVLCPTFYIHYNFSITKLYYLQLIFGLGGCISPVIVLLLFNESYNKGSTNNKMINKPEDSKSNNKRATKKKKSKFKNPLFLIKVSSLALFILQFKLIQLDIQSEISEQTEWNLYIIIGFYAFFFSLLFCSLKILMICKVRSRSVCLLWSWFELFQSIPLLTGTVLSAFLNDTFDKNMSAYFSAICCLIGFITLFSIDIHHRLCRKHKNSHLQKTQNFKLWTIKSNNNPNEKNYLKTDNLVKCEKNNYIENKSKKTAFQLINDENRSTYLQTSNDSNEMLTKFLNFHKKHLSSRREYIDQNLIRPNDSFRQSHFFEKNNEEIKDNNFYMTCRPKFIGAYPGNSNYASDSRHSLDTLLRKLSNQRSKYDINQFFDFTSLPELNNSISKYLDSNKKNYHDLASNCTSSSIFKEKKKRNSSLVCSAFNLKDSNDYTDLEKVIYLEKQNDSSEQSKQIKETSFIKNKNNRDNVSNSSLSVDDSYIEEINVNCNQLENDRQMLEDFNEMINENSNNDCPVDPDKFFVGYSQKYCEENDRFKDKKMCFNKEINDEINNNEAKKNCIENKNSSEKPDLSVLKKDNRFDNMLSGRLICDDYEHLIQSLLQSKEIERHQENCVMSNLLQEILKQITIKSLRDEFNNQTSPSDSPINIIHLQTNTNNPCNRKDEKSNNRFADRIRFREFDQWNENYNTDKFETNFINPSKISFLRENILLGKCIKCEKSLIN